MGHIPPSARNLGIALLIACWSSAAYGAAQCSKTSYSEARALMTNRLLGTGYSRNQTSFLMRNADLRISQLRGATLNDRAKPCRIDSARAYVLGCVNDQLFPLKGSKASLDATRQASFWGKTHLAGRELLFVGSFNACLGAAKQALFRG
ncbi:hypothetical protein [Mesorhizobium sp. WSM4904]|uniref:hypothetical protein n=1 Tax=Mesorhizobium sp. WSM4904 TaxID=3038545 RepID=UPI0024184774|nr:hypothetical protein [Mesorhizobium sp. WSM4904]WFP62948.1 hypothetical protein QAZ47_31765 [Mesorhizobium sp. WSM4904]